MKFIKNYVLMRKVGLMSLACVCAFASCQKNDYSHEYINDELRSSFDLMYPDARDIHWEDEGFYEVATFEDRDEELTAWFESTGQWQMTESSVDYSLLPEAMTTAIEPYMASGKIDFVETGELSRATMEPVYVMHAVSGNIHHYLFFSSDGILFKVRSENCVDNDGYKEEVLPEIPRGINDYLAENYEGGSVLDIEVEYPGVFIVTLEYDSALKKLQFDMFGGLVEITDMEPANLPFS